MGIGEELTVKVIDPAAKEYVRDLFLKAGENNVAAKKLYESRVL